MVFPTWSRALAVLAASQELTAIGYVCQVMTRDNATLQDSVGIRCSVEGVVCNCTASYVNGVTWLLATHDVNSTMKETAKRGEWYVMDSTGSCVATVANGSSMEPVVQKCPPGFYCDGGLEPPRSCSDGDYCPVGTGWEHRRCPFGKFCPIPGAPLQPCPPGGWCPEGSTRPDACPSGFFCEEGKESQCPRGFYCPFGTSKPQRCGLVYRCQPGSQSQDTLLVSLLIYIVCASVSYLGIRHYKVFVQHGVWVFVFCGCCVFMMCLLDEAIAFFLALLYFAVGTNWWLLQYGQTLRLKPESAEKLAHLLLACTAFVLLLLVGVVSGPWACFLGGLAYFSVIGYLMSRQQFVAVLAGRILVVVSFVLLFIAYWQNDRIFTHTFGVLLLLLVLGLLSTWFIEQYRLRGSVTIRSLTGRWHDREGPGGDLLYHSDSFVDLSMGVNAPSALGSLNEAHSSSTSSHSSTKGVPFSLEDVCFTLPDGKTLLKNNTFSIAAGRRVAVMGPSGSGKSTLLAVLSGRASYGRVSGKLKVGGRPADDLRFLQHCTGFVPQDDILHGELTVAENLRFQADLRLPADYSPAKSAESLERVIQDLQLEKIRDSRVGTAERRGVSGGQRKRVSIGMELVTDPLLLFADEPTSGLDSTTSFDVVTRLNGSAEKLGSTVIAVIHQPRYEMLQLFDDLVLLAVGGLLVYAGPSDCAETKKYFQTQLQVTFPQDTNPADVLLDAINKDSPWPEECARKWKEWKGSQRSQPCIEEPGLEEKFQRPLQPFVKAVMMYLDRSILQMIRRWPTMLINYTLCVFATMLLCAFLKYDRLDQFLLQSSLAMLFLMLLQGVAAQNVFGEDLLITWREAQVGMPMVAYFVAKDLAALVEVTLSSVVFAATYGYASGCQITLHQLFAGTWAFVFTVFGLNYIVSIVLSPGAAQMSAVCTSFVSFCTAGVYTPELGAMAAMFGGRGWMIPALSPIRWSWGYMLTAEVPFLSDLSREGARGSLSSKGYDLAYLGQCSNSLVGLTTMSFSEAWAHNIGWVCSSAPLLLLGVLFRFLAGVCLMLYVSAQTSGWARFFGQSDAGAWKLAGRLFAVLLGSVLALFLFAEIWIFGASKTPFHFRSPITSAAAETLGTSFV